MRPPRPHPFLGAEAGPADAPADALIVGLPTDGGSSFRRGAAEGPSGIRRFSHGIETYSPRARRDLEDLTVVDLGDDARAASRLGRSLATRADLPFLMSLGGDHSVTPGIVEVVARRADRLAVVGFDAHLDLRAEYPGEHACTFRRIADRGIACVVLGVRSGSKSEWEDASRELEYASGDLCMPPAVRRRLERCDVYLTIDADVLDPSAAPGVANPEPGGPGFADLLAAVESLEGLNVVAADVVEVAPPLDPSGVTQTAAAVLVRELLLRFTPG